MKEIRKIYQLKDRSIHKSSMYLGTNIGCVLDGDSNKMWFLSAAAYIDAALKTVPADLLADTN
jgi:hypothetical protein